MTADREMRRDESPAIMRAASKQLAVLCCLVMSGFALAEPRIALVIGNGRYADAPLINPASDAGLIGSTLEAAGFEVIMKRDADQQAMKRAIQQFGARLEQAGADAVGLFYFAGHGVQLDGRNVLIPIGSRIEREADLEIEGVSADWVLQQMRYARNRLNIVVLDACRNNPFVRSMRSASRGLARMDAPAGTFIAYSTAPGEVAADGSGRNSPYTAALAAAIRTHREPVEQVFKRARIEVMRATSDRQVPWESSSLTGDFFFLKSGVPTVAARRPDPVRPADARPSAPKLAAPTQAASTPAGSALPCGRVVGRWRVAGIEGEVAVRPDQTLEWWRRDGDRLPAITGEWSCQQAQSGRLVFTWNNGDVNQLTLSTDARRLTGTNRLGLPLSITRVN